MKKYLTVKDTEIDNKQQEEQIFYCNFCKKKAEFRCGLCLQATYCTPEHQKSDWAAHKPACARPEDKLKELNKLLLTYKKNFFDKLTKKATSEYDNICINILKVSKEIVQKFPNPQHQIEYGSAVCCYIKMLLLMKNFNQAPENLNIYVKQKIDFLRDTSNIPLKTKVQDPKYKFIIAFVEGKLKLLSVLCNIAHQIHRNSVYVIQILLAHCEKFYGPNSLQVSNVYFQLANYYNFMKQYNKACACYLVSARIRNENGVSAYYNAAIILMRDNHEYHKAIKFLLKCLEMINEKGDTKNIIHQVYLALAYCYKKLNHFDNTVQYLERALCQINLKHRFENNDEKYIRDLLRMLGDQYKKQFNNDQIISLPREIVTESDSKVIISNSNFDDYWEINLDTTKKKKEEEWQRSFKNQTQKIKYQSKIPMTNQLVQKQLFINHFTDDKNEDIAAIAKSSANDYINIDLEFMQKLTATEMKYLNELNKLLSLNKEKSAVYDIIENSNLMQQLSKQKIQRFYQLNPELIREKAAYELFDSEVQEPQPQPQKNSQPSANAPSELLKSKTPRNFKLDFDKIHKMKQQA